MGIHSYFLGFVIACLSYLFYLKTGNNHPSVVLKPEKRYDYIIVGGGTAGCVLASRLSEDLKSKVLLIEAGDHVGYFSNIPLLATAAQLGPNDWSFRTSPQKYSSFGIWNQTQIIPRGKGLGGSGQINFLLHGFGLPQDYIRWSELGVKGWSLEDLRPYFIKAFGTTQSEFDSSFCFSNKGCPGKKAPMKLQLMDQRNMLLQIFRQTSRRSSDEHTIFLKPTVTVRRGSRYSSKDAYLKPALGRKNLHVLLNTQGVSIRFEGKKASSLYILQNHRELNNVFVNKEIIISTGALKTPQLLMLSGIGPKKVLKRFKINVVSENKEVGMNLHDHMNMPIYVSIKKPISTTLSKVFTFGTFWDYIWKSTGFLSFPPVAGVEYQNDSAIILFSMGTASERLLRDLSNYKPKVFRDTFAFHNDTSKEGFMFLTTCVQPKSRGVVSLRDASTIVPPYINPNYLRNHWDVKCMIKAIRRAEDIVSSKLFRDIGAKIHWPRPERCMSFWRYSKKEQLGLELNGKHRTRQQNVSRPDKTSSPPEAYLECIIREVAVTGHHVGGTCAAGSVVDEKLRLKSVSGVRIVDASVLPSPTSLFPNSVIVAIAEKAADIIRQSTPL